MNSLHLILSQGAYNHNFNPLPGIFIILILYWISFKTKEGDFERFLLLIISLTFSFQVVGYFLNNFAVRDYINMFVFQTNIPDMVIFFTLLTYLIFKAKSYQLKN